MKKWSINDYSKALVVICAFGLLISCNKVGNTGNQGSDTTSTSGDDARKEAPLASPRLQAEGKSDGVKVTVDYGSPGVKGRKIWGGLESYGEVWRAGANETTAFTFHHDVTIGGVKVEAGTYGFYLILNENDKWTAIINADWSKEKHSAWGAYNYKKSHDVVRVELQPQWVVDNQERLKYEVTKEGILLAWEKMRLLLPIKRATAK